MHYDLQEPSNIPIYIQQDATLHGLFYLETALHVSDGNTTHHQEHKQLYLQHPRHQPAATWMNTTSRPKHVELTKNNNRDGSLTVHLTVTLV